MALNKVQLKSGIELLLTSLQDATDKKAAMDELAQGLADLIDSYIKTGTVTGTTASACTAGGAVGTCTGTIS